MVAQGQILKSAPFSKASAQFSNGLHMGVLDVEGGR